jgi:CBS domain containing-hemolysin-like protein
MANLTSGLVGFIISTGLIVIVGEIVPQASLHLARACAAGVPSIRPNV